ncbi:FepA family TonB-dependent siderophore receptor [Pleomorphomonas carboxyditropha]|uniref:TonB-dependent siderophore receptor n=1 Tax=Pleomorphomonas carboxyditropha TaxID=2023338 RepID=A0A2G9WTP0_9HYPH|nr:FepA family TonB-dependent siderophore receptor [Pleomorphomonas carboxyditropha]PIO98081.1 TonB-dependent siderophore receptor [Pleomorphomonas carboxyditropha]
MQPSAAQSAADSGASGHASETGDEASAGDDSVLLDPIVVTAEEQLKQMLGVSTITAGDLKKLPVTNDISELVRKMPGVNLTGTSSTGQRGNQRQIDLRGMGPDNTLILIDGKPVMSRNAVKMSRGGDRDSRGDSNWVPVDAIERIEVFRGPAAARYGSGAAGGVVNIITKRPQKLTVTASTLFELPQHGEEGKSFRTSLTVGGPVNDIVSFNLTGSFNRTSPDGLDINSDAAGGTSVVAGREGVRNYDVRGSVKIAPDETNKLTIDGALSRQGNLYAGDSLLSNLTDANAYLKENYGNETNRMTRGALSLQHDGKYDFGTSMSYLQWERTINSRLGEGSTGAIDGQINSDAWKTVRLDNLSAKSEWNLPFELGFEQTATLGAEFRGEFMYDPVSITTATANPIPGTPASAADRDKRTEQLMLGLYGEDNIRVTDDWTLTPGLRFDQSDTFGSNLSPSLNSSYELTPEISIKAGIARAFKAPNLYQLNPNYVYKTRGNGCPPGYSVTDGCYVVGNPDLDAETSINKEIGISYNKEDFLNVGLTYFHNDYKNRIAASTVAVGGTSGTYYYFQWDNTPEAVIQGLEGNLSFPITDTLSWSTNATYMIESKDKTYNQPLSLVPKYTINASLDWQVREDLRLSLSGTYYGEIAGAATNVGTGKAQDDTTREAYGILNFGLTYDVTEHLELSAGVKNILDERLFRTDEGANSYNEPGRSFYLGMNATF